MDGSETSGVLLVALSAIWPSMSPFSVLALLACRMRWESFVAAPTKLARTTGKALDRRKIKWKISEAASTKLACTKGEALDR